MQLLFVLTVNKTHTNNTCNSSPASSWAISRAKSSGDVILVSNVQTCHEANSITSLWAHVMLIKVWSTCVNGLGAAWTGHPRCVMSPNRLRSTLTGDLSFIIIMCFWSPW